MKEKKDFNTQKNKNFMDPDFIVGLVFFVLGILGFWYSHVYVYSEKLPGTGVAPDFYPKFLFVVLGLCGLGLMIQGYRREEKKQFKKIEWKMLLVTIIIFGGYAILFEYTGFIISTIIFMITFLILLGQRKPITIIAVPLITTFAIYLLFTKAFMIVVP